MNKGMPDIRPTRPEMFEEFGMTLLETLLAMTMLVVFTGVVAVVMQFTLRFFTTAESGEQNEFEVSNGVFIDHQQIQLAMDGVVEVLSQPGISLDGIAFDYRAVDPNVACPSALPVTQWGLPMKEVSLPPGYRLCLWKTTATESSMSALLADVDGAKPGIYFLQALPERLSSTSLPTRRLFCRPRPFC